MKNKTFSALVAQIEAYQQKKCELDHDKVRAIFEYIGLRPEQYNVENCLQWKQILISVPDQDKFIELQQLENICDNIVFILNRHSEAYFVCDYEQWRSVSYGKDQAELNRILRSGFGHFSQN
ncbi:MAG: hypothetical protein EOO48_02280 [Flavobacterium sp.]|nr:MAG: hypothetical protein EOO48_02280 [Flavobacterium sp.]